MEVTTHWKIMPIKVGRFFIGATLIGLLVILCGCSGGTSSTKSTVSDHGALGVALAACTIPPPGVLDCFGPPPAGDPSVFTGPFIGLQFAGNILDTLPPANQGAFVGGPSGTFRDQAINNVVQKAQLLL